MKSLVGFLLMFMLLSGSAFAASDIAVINTREALAKCNTGAQIVAQIQLKFKKRSDAVADLNKEVAKLQQDAQAPKAKDAVKRRFQEKLQELRAKTQQLRQEISREENERFQPLVNRLNVILLDYAKEKKLTGIQDRGQFIYVAPEADITEEIIKRLNAKP